MVGHPGAPFAFSNHISFPPLLEVTTLPDIFDDHSLFPPQFYHLVLESLNGVFQFCMFFFLTSKQMELSCVYSFYVLFLLLPLLFCKFHPYCCSLFFIAEQHSIVQYITIYLSYCSFCLFVLVLAVLGLCYCSRAFSRLQQVGATLHCDAQASLVALHGL